jgi:hypothetical protein
MAFSIAAVVSSIGLCSCCGNRKTDDAVIDATPLETELAANDSASTSAVLVTSVEPPKNFLKPVPNAPKVDASSVQACCSAVHTAGANATGKDRDSYQAAESVCTSLVKTVEKGSVTPSAAKLTIRAQLQHAGSIPGDCK